jgi:hypothetical protein
MFDRYIRAGAVTFALFATAAFGLVQPMPLWNAPLDEVVRHHRDHLLAFQVNGVLNLVSASGLLLFFAGLGRRFGGIAGAAIAASGTSGVALILVFHAAMLATLRAVDYPETVRTLWLLVSSGFPLTGLPLAGALAPIAVAGECAFPAAVARAAALPALLMAVLAVSAAVPAVFPVGVAAYPVFSLWLLLAAATLGRGRTAEAHGGA